MNHGNVAFYIKASIDQPFSFASTLDVPNVEPDDGYVQLWENFDNSWSRHYDNVLKDMVVLYDHFNHIS